ncbi:MAG TPA: MBL fold metallo-hydrolase [Kofleriaceae bacterium]|nr:MBL fold metallo-hydrolase [Kofleriaceae bacterium]
MRIHHLDAGTMCPALGRFIGNGRGLGRGTMVCHCLVVETAKDGLIVVDTGFGVQECERPSLLPRAFRALTHPKLDASACVVRQVEALGFTAADVRHVVVTHLDVDHAGGLPDFPSATVHLHRRELDAAMARATTRERSRYLPHQWAHGPRWSTYSEEGDTWLGVPAVRKLAGVDADVALIPLHGHTRGHSAIAVGTGGGWLLHAGDAYFHHTELVRAADAPVGLRWFQGLVQIDGKARHASAATLRRLHAEHPELTIVSAHDPVELRAATDASAAAA